MSKKEKRENLERGLRQELEAYVRKQQDKNEILKEIKTEDLAMLIKEAMMSEGSILKQLDGKTTKSTSNEQAGMADKSNPLETKELGVQSNVEMKGSKDSKNEKEEKSPSGGKVATFEEKVMEEITPILETVAEIRQVDHKLERESVKVKKENIRKIVNNINNTGSMEYARKKARERTNTKKDKPKRTKRSTSNVTKKDKEKIGKKKTPKINFKT